MYLDGILNRPPSINAETIKRQLKVKRNLLLDELPSPWITTEPEPTIPVKVEKLQVVVTNYLHWKHVVEGCTYWW